MPRGTERLRITPSPFHDAAHIERLAAALTETWEALDLPRAAMQLGGASGYAEGSPIERLARDAFAVTLHFENNDFLRRYLGRTLTGS